MNDKLSSKRARQGREGLPVLLILVGSLALAGIVWGIVEIYGVAIDEEQPVEMEQSSEVPLDGPRSMDQPQN